jgi:anionic cell wall polymer biosynthesis LytR-Cps2A-Psr (LCP) family protein
MLISIPRDLWVDLPLTPTGTVSYKINAAYAVGIDSRLYPDRPHVYSGKEGGGTLAKYAAGFVIGMPIDYYVAISFAGFTQAVNALGGVEVTVPYTFEDQFFPVEGKEKDSCGKSDEDIKKTIATLSGFLLEKEFPCRYETLNFKKGSQIMDAGTALKFVRSRHSDINGGDFGRSLRQQAFLSGVKAKIFSAGILPKIVPFFQNVVGSIETDITAGVISQMLARYGDVSHYSVASLGLTEDTVLEASMSADKQYILVPKRGDWSGIHTYITDQIHMMGQETPSATISGSR